MVIPHFYIRLDFLFVCFQVFHPPHIRFDCLVQKREKEGSVGRLNSSAVSPPSSHVILTLEFQKCPPPPPHLMMSRTLLMSCTTIDLALHPVEHICRKKKGEKMLFFLLGPSSSLPSSPVKKHPTLPGRI